MTLPFVTPPPPRLSARHHHTIPLRPSSSHLSPRSCLSTGACRAAPSLSALFTSGNTHPAWDTSSITSSSAWRLLLLSDGHLAGHLHVLTSGALRPSLMESTLAPSQGPGFHGGEFSAALPRPTRRRQMRLLDGQGRVLAHATTLWDARLYKLVFGEDETRTVWEALRASRFGTARALLGVEYGHCSQLAREIGVEDDSFFWARELVLKRDGKPMAVVHEILTPELENYIGPMTAPEDTGPGGRDRPGYSSSGG